MYSPRDMGSSWETKPVLTSHTKHTHMYTQPPSTGFFCWSSFVFVFIVSRYLEDWIKVNFSNKIGFDIFFFLSEMFDLKNKTKIKID